MIMQDSPPGRWSFEVRVDSAVITYEARLPPTPPKVCPWDSEPGTAELVTVALNGRGRTTAVADFCARLVWRGGPVQPP
jgi:hypothetical protein